MISLAKPGEFFQISKKVNINVTSSEPMMSIDVEPTEFLMYVETTFYDEIDKSKGYLHWFLNSTGKRVPFYSQHWLETSLIVFESISNRHVPTKVILKKIEI